MIIQMGRFIFMKTLRAGWLSAPAWGDIYIYMTIIFKHLLCNRMTFVEGERKFVLMVKVT